MPRPADCPHCPTIWVRVFLLIGWLSAPACTAFGQDIVKITGTVIDAAKNPIQTGSVDVAFGSDKVGDESVPITKGVFSIEKKLPGKIEPPLMMKLTFYAKVGSDPLPPRYIECLSPRKEQTLHVVMYTDSQLQKASGEVLFSEGQQLENAIFTWSHFSLPKSEEPHAPKNSREKYREHYSAKMLDARREAIYKSIGDAVSNKTMSKDYADYIGKRFHEKGEIASRIKAIMRP